MSRINSEESSGVSTRESFEIEEPHESMLQSSSNTNNNNNGKNSNKTINQNHRIYNLYIRMVFFHYLYQFIINGCLDQD